MLIIKILQTEELQEPFKFAEVIIILYFTVSWDLILVQNKSTRVELMFTNKVSKNNWNNVRAEVPRKSDCQTIK